MAGRKRKRQKIDDDILRTAKVTRLTLWHENLPAFDTPVDASKGLLSTMPSEILDNVLSFLVLDHDPERVAKACAKGAKGGHLPHALLSMATMSRQFRDLVEGFSRRYVNNHKVELRYWTRKANGKADAVEQLGLRRSLRLASKPTVARPIVYRMELVLTDALRWYDLRPYMLLKSRLPGPRAKHTDLPTIPYNTVWASKGFGNGWGISWRFLKRDVLRIARLVHGDVDAHMQVKRLQQERRRRKKDARVRKQLKLRYHQDALTQDRSDDSQAYHCDRLSHFHQVDSDHEWDSDDSEFSGYGDYDDVHERLCRNNCERCWDREWERKFDRVYGL